MIYFVLAGGAAFLSAAMALAWQVQRGTGNSGWADAFWSYSLGFAGVVFALAPLTSGQISARQWLVAALAFFWSARLGLHITSRTLGASKEDARYAALRREWGKDFQRRLFWFLQVQAAAAFFLALSILLAAHNPAQLGIKDYIAVAILIAAVAGEGIADRQLSAFVREKKNCGKICEAGLWSWSRHPNYFFEWFGWLAYPLLAISLSAGYPWGLLALSGSAFMYLLLVHVSGIPPLESHMLRKHGARFRAYQKRVSAFVPLPPKTNAKPKRP